MFDIVIRGGEVIDGTGRERVRADVAVSGGKIAAIGRIKERGQEEIDASGCYVTPGFIDVHTHYDAQVFWDPTLSPSCYYGVTTIFGGFCGFTIAPLAPGDTYLMRMLSNVEEIPIASLKIGVPWSWNSFGEYLAAIQGRLGVNAGFMVGHSALRRMVMGDRALGDEATPEDLEAMKALLTKSLTEGGMGFSTSRSATHNDAEGRPVPSRFASEAECVALAGMVRDHEGTLLELLPGTDPGPQEAALMTEISLAGGRPVNWNALLVNDLSEAELQRVDRMLSMSTYARERGAEVVALTIPSEASARMRLAGGLGFDALPNWAPLFALPIPARIEKLKDAEYRRFLYEQALLKRGTNLGYLTNWDAVRVETAYSPQYAKCSGMSLAELGRTLGKDPFDAMLDVAIADELETLFVARFGTDDREAYAERARLWRDDRTVVGASDAGAHVESIDTFSYPLKMLENGVRRHGVMEWEAAIQQLTEVPAKLYGLRGRGRLTVGGYADFVVLNPKTIGVGPTVLRDDLPGQARRLYSKAIGVDYVGVNGRITVAQGVHTGALPGQLLRSGKDTYTVTIPGAGRA